MSILSMVQHSSGYSHSRRRVVVAFCELLHYAHTLTFPCFNKLIILFSLLDFGLIAGGLREHVPVFYLLQWLRHSDRLTACAYILET